MDNVTPVAIIAIQLQDLDELEASGDISTELANYQRDQLQSDALFDQASFDASLRLATSMAKAVEQDSDLLASMSTTGSLDDATFATLATLNRLPMASAPSPELETDLIGSESLRDTVDYTADCVICLDVISTGDWIEVSYDHRFCKDCFSACVTTSLEPGNAFPPTCCGIAISFMTVVNNVSPEVFQRYQSRQQEQKTVGLYCSQSTCAVKIPDKSIDGTSALYYAL